MVYVFCGVLICKKISRRIIEQRATILDICVHVTATDGAHICSLSFPWNLNAFPVLEFFPVYVYIKVNVGGRIDPALIIHQKSNPPALYCTRGMHYLMIWDYIANSSNITWVSAKSNVFLNQSWNHQLLARFPCVWWNFDLCSTLDEIRNQNQHWKGANIQKCKFRMSSDYASWWLNGLCTGQEKVIGNCQRFSRWLVHHSCVNHSQRFIGTHGSNVS